MYHGKVEEITEIRNDIWNTIRNYNIDSLRFPFARSFQK